MAKKFIARARHKAAFKRGFEEASGVNKASGLRRFVQGDAAVAAENAAEEKYYAAGRAAAPMVAASAVTLAQAYTLAEERIDAEPVQLDGDVLARAREDAAAGVEEVEEGEAVDFSDVDEAEVDEASDDLAEFDESDVDEADDDDADGDEADED